MSESIMQRLQAAYSLFQTRDLAGAERMVNEVLAAVPGNSQALHLLGAVRLASGRAGQAAEIIGRALASNPHDAGMQETLGVARAMQGDFAGAETAFRQALASGAAHGLLHMRLGLALSSQGRAEEALAEMRNAAAVSPDTPDVLLNLGNALTALGRNDEGLACYERLLALAPGHPAVHFNLANLYRNTGRLDDAAASYRQVIAAVPDDADAHNNLGLVLDQQQRHDEAAECYRRALALAPGHTHALNNLGNALKREGRLDEAIEHYERVIAVDARHQDAYLNLGNARSDQGRYADAATLYEKVLTLNPRNFEAHYNLGMLRKMQGEPRAAIVHYRRALEAEPDAVLALKALGAACQELGEAGPGATAYRRALEIDPADADAHHELAETLKLPGRLDEAIAQYELALERRPDHWQALNGLIHLRQHVCDWHGIEALWQRLRDGLAAGTGTGAGVAPFGLLAMPSTPAEQLACARGWAKRALEPLAVARERLGFEIARPRPGGRLRVGYLSWGFHRHATAYLAAELFELHDRGRFEVYAYAYGPDDGSAIRARIRSACEHFTDISADSYAAAAQRIYRDNIDVLVDLTGYTLGARTQILALRPAPVQVNWLGYPGTMGADCLDCIVADPVIIPAGEEAGYAEKVIRLPHCYQINDRRREVSAALPSRVECGLPEHAFVFCCFNQAYKLLPDTFALWMRVLQAVPGSVLWLAEANRWATDNLRRAAGAAGIEPERLVFAPRKPLPDYLAQYRLADLALDTFPYASHTTASDALWMGCPLVTRAGDTFAARVAASILAAGGLADCIATAPGEYESMVLDLARTPEKLATLRQRTEAARNASPLFDTPRFVRDLEAAFERLCPSA